MLARRSSWDLLRESREWFGRERPSSSAGAGRSYRPSGLRKGQQGDSMISAKPCNRQLSGTVCAGRDSKRGSFPGLFAFSSLLLVCLLGATFAAPADAVVKEKL